MINKEQFLNKKILILGLARSGVACANLLHDLGAQLWVSDNQENDSTKGFLAKLRSKDIKVELGKHSRDFIHGKDMVVISPGVPDDSPAVIWAKEAKIPIISEIELAWRLCPAEVIATTGTNGKTTVTTLIGKILEASGRRVFVCGNIGKPFTSQVELMQPGDFVSLEVSSFQLEYIDTFKPKIAILLNLSRNHLDRYSEMSGYLAAKKRIFINQDDSEHLILNFDDPCIRDLAKETRSKAIYFKREPDLNPNQSAVLAVAGILNIERQIVERVFKEFKGVEHRMEEVIQLNGVRFINDSKSTTTEATVWALNNIASDVVLICGGREKGNDYTQVLEAARNKVKAAVLIGEAKDKIRKAFQGVINLQEALTLEEAVKKASSLACSGECVLFSPMCKSFDMFTNYEERGKKFKSLVIELSKGKV